jgi:phage-related protein
MAMKTTQTIEKYELRITSAMKKIQEIQSLIERRSKIMGFSFKNPDKITEAVAKLREARKNLNDAIGLLLDSGNTKKNL